MNKPLTIEQLKALPMGEWVWLDFQYSLDRRHNGYYQIKANAERTEVILCGIEHDYLLCDYGTTWLAYKNKEQAVGEYDSLAVENEVLKRDKANLERTIEEINEALKANGITIDSDGNVNDSRVEQAKRQTAKAILQDLYNQANNQWQAIEWTTEDIKQYAKDKHGVEVEE